MARLIKNEDFHEAHLMEQITAIENHTNLMKNQYCFDSRANEYFDWILDKMNKVKILTFQDPRFDWQILQYDIDNLFKRANGSLKGFNILIDLDSNSPYEMGYLKYNISELKK
ncbi:hypothetical protein [Algibacter lectus]|uniref:hypothetical protein n=1 Tax=Algibacter lectus TaxID=221126 RepID=UPI0026F24767|nr:hypothetical protein [Algibacter lectus]MDO7138907.1 hypothetical protein [Algibacter lectus]